jgi:hypothetical protein
VREQSRGDVLDAGSVSLQQMPRALKAADLRNRPLSFERPFPIGKVVYAPPTMECLPALFTIKAAVSHDRSLYLDRAMKRTTKQATEIDAHRWLVGHRTLVAAVAPAGRR